MNGPGKSDPSIVPGKRPNRPGQPGAEAVEGRGGAEGTAGRQSTVRTLSRDAVSQALARVREAAKRNKRERFTSLMHHVTPDLLVYATQRTGYRSGGFFQRATLFRQRTPFEPERVLDREIGVKSEFSLGEARVRVNLDYYKDKYKDLQKNLSQFVDGFSISSTFNAAEGTVKGFESDFQLEINRLTIGGSYTYTDQNTHKTTHSYSHRYRNQHLHPHKHTYTYRHLHSHRYLHRNQHSHLHPGTADPNLYSNDNRDSPGNRYPSSSNFSRDNAHRYTGANRNG